ncbi:hypothetical protein HYV30_02850 [Candidatus Kaiserbacteria bacterium]|nr:hypothetical protein [Candidatus Kaiserbacteria bacterium]
MFDERTDLLPPERARSLRREYLVRLGIVSLLSIAVLACVAAVLLVPTYLYLAATAHSKEAQLARIEASSAEDSRVSERLSALAGSLDALRALSAVPTASEVLRTALALPHPGISLATFAYTPATDKKRGTLAITGIAATRDALRAYQLVLEGTPLFASATLPVSAYAKETDSVFTITLTLASLEKGFLTEFTP